ncbi:response regulator [Poseidonibacter lekithochrous]|uniref:response regulator n=1 Tax=Poseidonibacter lekithochrous TaxID=1904463 RepID=UPI000ABA1F3B|nr:response regulator [Poseidonibacter lekithochrous]QKJ22081.1 two-component system response regulator [Poseidonibacter lekithochrous]
MTKLSNLSQNDIDISILIVEDEVILAMSMEVSLKKMGYEVTGIETSAAQAINHARNRLPDLVIMDINLNNSSGIDAANEIWKSLKIPIIFLTSYSNDKTINQAMECEPYGYLIKPCRDRDLKATITMAIHKHRYFFANKKQVIKEESQYILIEGNLSFDKTKSALYKNDLLIKLTKNEKKLFEIMCENPNSVISFEQISAYVWREELYDMGKLRTLIYRLRQKLEFNPLENVYESGYKLKISK